MIKVLHILWNAHFGGIERLVLDLSTVQHRDAEIQSAVLFGNASGEFIEKFQQARLPYYSLDLTGGYDISLGKCSQALKLFSQYDILHFHGFNPTLAFVACISRKKIIYTVHGTFGFGREKKWEDTAKSFLLKIFLRSHVNYVSYNSHFTKKVALDRYAIGDIESSVVYNGALVCETPTIMTSGVDEAILEKLRGKYVVGTSSRFVGVKRIDRLIKAFAAFQAGKNAVLLLVGDGILRDILERLVSSLGIAEKTIFTGFRKNVSEYQALMDICVFPSESEAFGLVAVETLALGKVVLVYRDGGGLVEIIESIAPEDVVADEDHLVRRLEYYYENKDEISRHAEQRKDYSKKFDARIMATEFDKIYRRILECAE